MARHGNSFVASETIFHRGQRIGEVTVAHVLDIEVTRGNKGYLEVAVCGTENPDSAVHFVRSGDRASGIIYCPGCFTTPIISLP